MKKRLLALILSCCMVSLVFRSADINHANAASRQLNIITTFDISETATYGVPNAFMSRFDEISNAVAGVYLDRFAITLNFTKPTTNYVVSSCAYECRASTGNYYEICNHARSANCDNNGTLHHTNIHVIKEDVMPTLSANAIDMHITAVKLCVVNSDGIHNTLNGVNIADERIIVTDLDYKYQLNMPNPSYCDTYYVAQVVAHEIGHSYDVVDHYYAPSEYGSGWDDCIWGYNKVDREVREAMKMCMMCKQTILLNNDKYNHS